MREKMDPSQPLTKLEFKEIYHPYRDLPEINITYFCLKSSIFFKVDVLPISVNYHEFVAQQKVVLCVSMAKMTLRSLWAVARTAFLKGRPSCLLF
jgi:hypothetical protein